ncbi:MULTISPECIES: hypothetical protein [unclassified Alteromonas]|uniref:hypothetical protein n=1 Tax=unclassified Alteromonas TaxID=2614992 RepID=UPI0019234AAA|nr:MULTISPECIES: hypothetical protein [unclassified Alteromonas]
MRIPFFHSPFSTRVIGLALLAPCNALGVDEVTKSEFSPLPDNYKKAIAEAITNFENTPINQWAYRVTRYENEEGKVTSSVEAYSPNEMGSAQWTLLQKNKQVPSQKALKAFEKQKQKQKQNTNIALKLSELIKLDSLLMSSASESEVLANFDVNFEKLGEDASKLLNGQLTYNVTNKFIKKITITNTESFSPVFAATINTLKVDMTFFKNGEAILPESITMTMQGRFAVFSEINEVSSDTYSHFRYVGSTSDSHKGLNESAK